MTSRETKLQAAAPAVWGISSGRVTPFLHLERLKFMCYLRTEKRKNKTFRMASAAASHKEDNDGWTCPWGGRRKRLHRSILAILNGLETWTHLMEIKIVSGNEPNVNFLKLRDISESSITPWMNWFVRFGDRRWDSIWQRVPASSSTPSHNTRQQVPALIHKAEAAKSNMTYLHMSNGLLSPAADWGLVLACLALSCSTENLLQLRRQLLGRV